MTPEEIPIEAYFRRAMTAVGVHAMEQISLMHVLVVGLRGCGIEIAKCLALSGIQRLTLMDEELVREEDLALGFLLCDGDEGKPKAKLVAARLNELAPLADVRTLHGSLSLDLLLNFHVVVFASATMPQEEVIAFDEFCRAQDPPIGVVVAESRGLFGSVFTDFSTRHVSLNTTPGSADAAFSVVNTRTQVHDDDRVDTISIMVKEPLVRVHLERGDRVILDETPTNEVPLILVVDEIVSDVLVRLRPTTTSVTRSEMRTRLRGSFTRLRRDSSLTFMSTHRSMREFVVSPCSIAFPTRGPDVDSRRGYSLHVASIAIHHFRREFGVLPKSNNTDHVEHMLTLIDEHLNRNTSCQSPERAATTHRGEMDRSLVARALRCASSEFLPLSALIAGHAALQVLKFSGVESTRLVCGHVGALGPALYPQSQLLFFDIIDLVGEVFGEKSTLHSPRDGSMVSIFGTDSRTRLRNAKVAVVGAGPTNMEMLKNLLRSAIATSGIHFIVDPNDNPMIGPVDLHDSVLFSPSVLGHQKISAIKALYQAITVETIANEDLASLRWEIWTTCSAIVAELSSEKSLLAIDDCCQTYEKPALLTYEDAKGISRIAVIIPHYTATFGERFIVPRHVENASIFPFDHLPSASGFSNDSLDRRKLLPSEILVCSAHKCFQMMFQTSIQVATRYAERDASTKVFHMDDTSLDEEITLWMVWTVAQRGHGVDDFHDCIRIAWQMLELLPLWMTTGPLDNDDEQGHYSKPEHDVIQSRNRSKALVELDTSDPDHIQLLVATACIIAASVRLAVPPVEKRRAFFDQAAQQTDKFSLHRNPRSSSSIHASFAEIDSAHLRTIIGRVEQITLDRADANKGHLHFLQALTNLQLLWSGQNANRVTTLPHLRLLSRDKRGFLPVTTILGALNTLQLIGLLINTSERVTSEQLHEYGISTTPTRSHSLQIILRPPAPLVARSMSHEATRGGPLRLIPDQLTRWSKIVVPTSAALQTAKEIVQFVETKFQIRVHAIHHHKRCVATVSPHTMTDTDGLLTKSVFELCDSSALFVLLDLVAVDTDGDVVLAPLRINRK